jgi:hypothetical protein
MIWNSYQRISGFEAYIMIRREMTKKCMDFIGSLFKKMMDIKISPNMRMPILNNHAPRCSTPDSGFLRARSLARGSVFMSLCADTLPSPADDSILGQHKTALKTDLGVVEELLPF